MTKFLVIYNSPVGAREQMAKATPEQAKAGMDAWMAWAGKAGPSIVDLGSPVGNAVTLAAGGKTSATTTSAGGYSLLQAESRDALAQLLAEHPHLMMPGATIEVHEVLALPGM